MRRDAPYDYLMIDLVVCSAAEAEFADGLCWNAERSVSMAERSDAEFDQAMQTCFIRVLPE